MPSKRATAAQKSDGSPVRRSAANRAAREGQTIIQRIAANRAARVAAQNRRLFPEGGLPANSARHNFVRNNNPVLPAGDMVVNAPQNAYHCHPQLLNRQMVQIQQAQNQMAAHAQQNANNGGQIAQAQQPMNQRPLGADMINNQLNSMPPLVYPTGHIQAVGLGIFHPNDVQEGWVLQGQNNNEEARVEQVRVPQAVYPAQNNVQAVYPAQNNVQAVCPAQNQNNVQAVYPAQNNVQAVYPAQNNVQAVYPAQNNLQAMYPVQNNMNAVVMAQAPVVPIFQGRSQAQMDYQNQMIIYQGQLAHQLGQMVNHQGQIVSYHGPFDQNANVQGGANPMGINAYMPPQPPNNAPAHHAQPAEAAAPPILYGHHAMCPNNQNPANLPNNPDACYDCAGYMCLACGGAIPVYHNA